MQPALVITGVSGSHTATVATLLWRRRRAGGGAPAQRKGTETLHGVAGLGWQAAAGAGCGDSWWQLGDMPNWCVGKARGSTTSNQLLHHHSLGVRCTFFSFPTWVTTGQVRIFLIDSILVGFSVLLPCCLGCFVSFFGRQWFQFHFTGNRTFTLHCRDAVACTGPAEDPARKPGDHRVQVSHSPPARRTPLRLQLRHVASEETLITANCDGCFCL